MSEVASQIVSAIQSHGTAVIVVASAFLGFHIALWKFKQLKKAADVSRRQAREAKRNAYKSSRIPKSSQPRIAKSRLGSQYQSSSKIKRRF